jgi:hypothetical protein
MYVSLKFSKKLYTKIDQKSDNTETMNNSGSDELQSADHTAKGKATEEGHSNISFRLKNPRKPPGVDLVRV